MRQTVCIYRCRFCLLIRRPDLPMSITLAVRSWLKSVDISLCTSNGNVSPCILFCVNNIDLYVVFVKMRQFTQFDATSIESRPSRVFLLWNELLAFLWSFCLTVHVSWKLTESAEKITVSKWKHFLLKASRSVILKFVDLFWTAEVHTETRKRQFSLFV